MKGRLGYEKWSVSGHDSFYMGERIVDGKSQVVYVSSHCLACAKTDILAKHGGQVDTRGWHKQGICGSFLMAMIQEIAQEES
jgi:hypothetical protein